MTCCPRRSPWCARRRAGRLGERQFDVQLMGGIVLHQGRIVEMKTGEGKTLASVPPPTSTASPGGACTWSRSTTTSPSATPQWMGRIYRLLGVSVGVILGQMDNAAPQGGLRAGHHLRHQQRVRLRLPARQHVLEPRREGPARPRLRASSTRSTTSSSTRPARRSSSRARPRTTPPGTPRPTSWSRASGECAKDPRHGRATPRKAVDTGDYKIDEKNKRVTFTDQGMNHIEELLRQRRGSSAARCSPTRTSSTSTTSPRPCARTAPVPQGRGLRGAGRQGADRRRVHGPHPARPALLRGPAPGHRGQGAHPDRPAQPHPRHDHLPELLPHVRQARRA